MNRKILQKQWQERFKQINGRKPSHLEDLSWRVGWNMCEDDIAECKVSDDEKSKPL